MGFREDLQFILRDDVAAHAAHPAVLGDACPKPLNYYAGAALSARRVAGHQKRLAQPKAMPISNIAPFVSLTTRPKARIVNLLRFMDPLNALVFCATRQVVRRSGGDLAEESAASRPWRSRANSIRTNATMPWQALRDGRAQVRLRDLAQPTLAARGLDLPNLAPRSSMPTCRMTRRFSSTAAAEPGAPDASGVSILLVPHSRRRRAEEMLSRCAMCNSPGAEQDRPPRGRRDPFQTRFWTGCCRTRILTEPGSDEELTMANMPSGCAQSARHRGGLREDCIARPCPRRKRSQRCLSPRGGHQGNRESRGPRDHRGARNPNRRALRPYPQRRPGTTWKTAFGSRSPSGASAMPTPNGCCRRSAARARSPRKTSAPSCWSTSAKDPLFWSICRRR